MKLQHKTCYLFRNFGKVEAILHSNTMKSVFQKVVNRIKNPKIVATAYDLEDGTAKAIHSSTSEPYFDFTIYSSESNNAEAALLSDEKEFGDGLNFKVSESKTVSLMPVLSTSSAKEANKASSSDSKTVKYDDRSHNENSHPNRKRAYSNENQDHEPKHQQRMRTSADIGNSTDLSLEISSTHSSVSDNKRYPRIDERFHSERSVASSSYSEEESKHETMNRPDRTENSSDIDIDDVFSKVRHNRIEIVTSYLEKGFDVFSIDANGNSMLHICSQNNNKKLASLALKYGCPINARNHKGLTAMDYCVMYKFDTMATWLSSKGGYGTRKSDSELSNGGSYTSRMR